MSALRNKHYKIAMVYVKKRTNEVAKKHQASSMNQKWKLPQQREIFLPSQGCQQRSQNSLRSQNRAKLRIRTINNAVEFIFTSNISLIINGFLSIITLWSPMYLFNEALSWSSLYLLLFLYLYLYFLFIIWQAMQL